LLIYQDLDFRKHKNELTKLKRAKKINRDCKICGYFARNDDDWEVHVTSENHINNSKLQSRTNVEIPPPIVPPPPSNLVPLYQPPVSTSPSIPPETSKQNTTTTLSKEELEKKLNEKALIEILSKNKKEWRCANCNIICQSHCSWKAHLASKKHHKNAHKFRTYPGISKEVVQRKYQKSFVRANESIGNEFIEDGVIFYCKRCNVRMSTKQQLEIHMDSNLHKSNYPIQPPVSSSEMDGRESNPRVESSSYGYAGRNWVYEQQFLMQSAAERQKEMEAEYERQLVEKAKNDLLARFPYYALNMQQQQQSTACSLNPENIPMPVEPPAADSLQMLNLNYS
jgi:hypothetical protein